jgi:hypothetical protein
VSIGIPFDFDYGFRAVRDDLEIQRVTSPAAGLRAVFGAGMREDRLDAPLRFNSSERVRSGVNRAFGTLEWRASPQWLFNAGFMVEDNSLTGTSLAPRASANYHMTENQTLRFAVNRSYRSPIAFEQKSSMIFSNSAPIVTPFLTIPAGTPISQTFRPSPGLRAERITTYEMGYLAELRPLHATLDARLFLERARDLIEMRLENSSAGLIPATTRATSPTAARPTSGAGSGRHLAAGHRNTWLSLQHTELRIDGPSATRPPRAEPNPAPGWKFRAPAQLRALRRLGIPPPLAAQRCQTLGRRDELVPGCRPPHGMYRQLDLQSEPSPAALLGRGEIAVSARNIDGDDETFAPGPPGGAAGSSAPSGRILSPG